MTIRTWHIETLVVAVALGTVAIATGGGPIELLGAGAVLLTFGHASVSERLAEREAARERPSVDCHRWATRYFVGKELLWLLYFVLHHSWSALAGVGLFLLYPAWRRFWRARHPPHFGDDMSTTIEMDIKKTPDGRIRDVEHIEQFFAFEHLPERLRAISQPFGELAARIIDTLPRNSERTVALRKLLEAKDAAVRAAIAK